MGGAGNFIGYVPRAPHPTLEAADINSPGIFPSEFERKEGPWVVGIRAGEPVWPALSFFAHQNGAAGNEHRTRRSA